MASNNLTSFSYPASALWAGFLFVRINGLINSSAALSFALLVNQGQGMQRRSLNAEVDLLTDDLLSRSDKLSASDLSLAMADKIPEFNYRNESTAGFPRTLGFLVILTFPAAVVVTKLL